MAKTFNTINIYSYYDGKAGISVESVVDEYYLSVSDTNTSGGSWSVEIPEYITDRYYWTRLSVTYSDGVTKKSDAVLAPALTDANEKIIDFNNGLITTDNKAEAALSQNERLQLELDNSQTYMLEYVEETYATSDALESSTTYLQDKIINTKSQLEEELIFTNSTLSDLENRYETGEAERKTIYTFNGMGITVGTNYNSKQTFISHNEIEFRTAGVVDSKLDSSELVIDKVYAKTNVKIGNYILQQKAGGNLSLDYRGGS